MSGCCDQCSVLKSGHAAACPVAADEAPARLTIALAGNPNSGKTTVFNALTGLRQKVGNYPGVTVEKKLGLCRLPDGSWANVIDLPGTYSLVSRSPDEHVAMEVLHGLRGDTPVPDAVVAVVDASNLQRNLYFVSQLIELGTPLVIALNMTDVAERRGVAVDPAALARRIGVPVVPIVGHKRRGIAELVRAIAEARPAPVPDWPLPGPMKREVRQLSELLARGNGGEDRARRAPVEAAAERLLIEDEPEDLPRIHSGAVTPRLVAAARERVRAAGIDPMQADIEAHYTWIESVFAECVGGPMAGALPHEAREEPRNEPRHEPRKEPRHELRHEPRNEPRHKPRPAPQVRPTVHFTERLDAILLHRVWGLLFFLVIMGAMFASMFWLAKPIQGALGTLVARAGELVSGFVPAGALRSLVHDGIFAGVGAVVVFVPQIAILFLFLAVLEDSGYLSRAAFLMDRLLSKVGLHGKSFIPLLSGFACAIPAVMATRTIEQRKGRLATILVIPLITCSARLPVYGLLVASFFAGVGALRQAGILLGLYVLGIGFAAGAAFLFRRTLLQGRDSGFILELPTYKAPQLSHIARQVWSNSGKFVTRAGSTIFLVCLVLWGVSYYPRLPQSEAARMPDAPSLGAAQQSYSFAGRLGRAIEPGIRPLGFDWKIGVGCISAFAAREVFVSTMAIVYGTGDGQERNADLAASMRADVRPDGRAVWTPLVALSVLLWFVLAMQCLSTVMVVRQETGGWRWPLFLIGYMNAAAYIVCLLVYQIGSRVFGG